MTSTNILDNWKHSISVDMLQKLPHFNFENAQYSTTKKDCCSFPNNFPPDDTDIYVLCVQLKTKRNLSKNRRQSSNILCDSFQNMSNGTWRSSNSHSLATKNILLLGIYASFLGMIFNVSLLIVFIHRIRLMKPLRRNNSHRIGLCHTINTYIHVLGILSILFLMHLRTFFNDFSFKTNGSLSISWDCYLLSHLFTFFEAGVYGSCFLQAIFRYWRIMFSDHSRLQNFNFHLLLIFLHWILLNLLLLPTVLRSSYIPSEHICHTAFDDRYIAVYVAIIVTVIPVGGICVFYIKIILFMKTRLHNRKRMRNDLLTIRRIFFLVIIIFQTSIANTILWMCMFFQENLHRIFYRLLLLLVILCMLIFSVTLLLVSPHLRQILRSNQVQYSRRYSISLKKIEKSTQSRGVEPVQI